MANTAADPQQTTNTNTRDPELFQQARNVFSGDAAPPTKQQPTPVFSVAHLIPLDEVKRLGVYTPAERPQLIALFEYLTTLIDSRYQLMDGQKVIVKIERLGTVELTTDKRLYSEVPEQERARLMNIADLTSLVVGIGRTLRSWDHSEHLRIFDTSDHQYWLKELGNESDGYISGIFPPEQVAKLQKEVFAPIRQAITESSFEEPAAPAATTKDVSTAVVNAEAVAAAVAAYSSSSGQIDADAGVEQGDEAKVSVDEKHELDIDVRALQLQRDAMLGQLSQELYRNVLGDFASSSSDQAWADIQAVLLPELWQFLMDHPEFRQNRQASLANQSAAQFAALQQFLISLETNSLLRERLENFYIEVGEEIANEHPNQAEEFVIKLTEAIAASPLLAEVITSQEVAKIAHRAQQAEAIAEIPQASPAVSAPATSSPAEQAIAESESKLQEAATNYLTVHAEYEIFKKTRIFLQQLPPDLDLSAQNIRLELAEFARQQVLGLTASQLRFVQQDPSYARALYERFLQNLRAARPEITSFLIQVGRHLDEHNPAEAALFAANYRKGIFSSSNGKDALVADLQGSLGGAATPVVAENITTTIDAMLLEFGAGAPEFVKRISPERLALIFGLPAGTLTSATLPGFLTTLESQMAVRLTELQLVSPDFFAVAGFASPEAGATPEAADEQLTTVSSIRGTTAALGGSEIVVVAMVATPEPEADRKKIWNGLTPEEQDLFCQKTGGTPLGGNPPVGFETWSIEKIQQVILEIQLQDSPFAHKSDEGFAAYQQKVAKREEQIERARLVALLGVIAELKEGQAEILAAHFKQASAVALAEQLTEQIAQLQVSPVVLQAMANAAEVAGDAAFSGFPPNGLPPTEFVQDWNQGGGRSPLRSSVGGALRHKLGDKLKSEIGKKLITGAATKLGMAATGVGALPAIALTVLQNKTLRNIAVGGGTLVVAKTLYALTTIGGMAGAAIGAFLGAGLGPLGAVLGGVTGANVGASIIPAQWTNLFGWTPHAPPSIGSYFGAGESAGGVSPLHAETSLRALRGAEASASPAGTGTVNQTAANQAAAHQQLASNSQGTAMGGPGTSSSVAVQSPANISSTGASTAATSSSLTGFLGTTTAAIAATGAPLIGIGIGLFLSIQVLFIIYGAFLISVPSEGVEGDTKIDQSKYVTLTKKASATSLANTAVPAEITYTISLTPKQQYSIKIKTSSDTFRAFAETELTPPVSSITSDWFSPEQTNSPQTTEYAVALTGTDAFIVNTLQLQFDVYNSAGVLVVENETARASAAVRIGNPKVGCWPTTGSIAQLPGGNFSHDNPYLEAFDIMAPLGTPIYAPFAGSLIGRSSSRGRGYGEHGILTTTSGSTLFFGHMIEKPKDTTGVLPGDLIGYVGNTGFSTGPHLHYEVKGPPGSFLELLIGSDSTNVGDLVTTCFN